jgi:CHAD domain
VAPGFKRIYRRGRRVYHVACAAPSTENLHELRKRAKDLWYPSQIVRPAAPKKLKRIARRAHELSNLIGEDHDLAILDQRAGERRDRVTDEKDVGELARLAGHRRDELRREAMDIGRRLFVTRPRMLVQPAREGGRRRVAARRGAALSRSRASRRACTRTAQDARPDASP